MYKKEYMKIYGLIRIKKKKGIRFREYFQKIVLRSRHDGTKKGIEGN